MAPLTNDLLQLSREIPTLTNELQDLAARGAQMGIAADDVADFAEVMAKFVATSPEVDVNSVAEAFGRLSNLTGTKDFEAMASAIAQVGVNSAATDAQIIKTTQEIARATNATSLSASEVIGLAAAFASLGVAPEAARGIMNQFFTQLEKGAAGMNDSMAVAAQVIGQTEEATRSLFKNDAGQFFQQFVSGLADAESAVLVLDQMGLQGQRLIPAFNALTADTRRNAEGQTVLANALRDANQGFAERTELDRQFAPIADDLNSKFILMQNSLMELAYAVGTELAPTMKGFVDVVIQAVQATSDFVESPVGGFMVKLAAGVAAVTLAYTSLRTAIALSHAMMIAFNTAAGTGAVTGLAGSLRGLIGMFSATGAAASGAATGVGRLVYTLKALGRATVIGAVLQYVAEWLFNTAGAAQQAGNTMISLADIAMKVAQAIGSVFGPLGSLIGALGVNSVLGKTRDIGASLSAWGKSLESANSGIGGMGDGISTVAGYVPEVEEGFNGINDAANGAAGGVGDMAREVRTLLDYASDLSSVWNRAFDIRFSGQDTLDNVTSQFIKIREENERAAKAIRDLQNDIRGLNSDISIQEYYLSIAIEYGDTKRAEAIEAQLEKTRAELADKTLQLQKEQDKANKSLVGNTQGNIDNRKAITDLVKGYQAHLEALAASGASQAELAAANEQLKAAFIAQATQLGFNQAELGKYAAAFDDVAVAIRSVPRNITVEANVNPAIQAMNELNAKVRSTVDGLRSTIGSGISIPVNTVADVSGARRSVEAMLAALRPQYTNAVQSGNDNAAIRLLKQIRNLEAALGSIGWAEGGYTGAGGKYEVAGAVHRGEYVIPKRDVNQTTGLPYAHALGKLMTGQPGYANGGYAGRSVGGGAVVASLDAASIQYLAQAVQQYVVLEGRVLAHTTSNQYAASSAAGAN